MLYGAAQSLAQIVGFRSLQGMFSAALVPLSQATLLDIYPLERRGFAMAILGHGGDDRADHGSDAGRLPDRQPRLAVGFLHQRAVRAAGGGC